MTDECADTGRARRGSAGQAGTEEFRADNTFDVRHAVLAGGYGGADDPTDPLDVLVMPLVLHIPASTLRCAAKFSRQLHERRSRQPIRAWGPVPAAHAFAAWTFAGSAR